MNKFKKKPVVIEAWQFTRENFDKGVPQEIDRCEHIGLRKEHFIGSWVVGSIKTLEGVMEVREGDWIIKGVQGEFYPCKPDIFEQTYEVAE